MRVGKMGSSRVSRKLTAVAKPKAEKRKKLNPHLNSVRLNQDPLEQRPEPTGESRSEAPLSGSFRNPPQDLPQSVSLGEVPAG